MSSRTWKGQTVRHPQQWFLVVIDDMPQVNQLIAPLEPNGNWYRVTSVWDLSGRLELMAVAAPVLPIHIVASMIAVDDKGNPLPKEYA